MDMDIEPTVFDVIVVGTGLPEAILAGAAAQAGKSVLHLDSAESYGSHWASLQLDAFMQWAELHGHMPSPQEPPPPVPLPPSERPVLPAVPPPSDQITVDPSPVLMDAANEHRAPAVPPVAGAGKELAATPSAPSALSAPSEAMTGAEEGEHATAEEAAGSAPPVAQGNATSGATGGKELHDVETPAVEGGGQGGGGDGRSPPLEEEKEEEEEVLPGGAALGAGEALQEVPGGTPPDKQAAEEASSSQPIGALESSQERQESASTAAVEAEAGAGGDTPGGGLILEEGGKSSAPPPPDMALVEICPLLLVSLNENFHPPEYSQFAMYRYADISELGQSRAYSLDLGGPRVALCAGAMVELLLTSGAHNYVEFQSVEGNYIWANGGATPVPASRNALFKDRNLSVRDKRVIGKFIELVADVVGGAGTPGGSVAGGGRRAAAYDPEEPFVELLKREHQSEHLRSFVLYAIAMADTDQEGAGGGADLMAAREGLQRTALFQSSVARYGGAQGAHLYPLYGQGEFAQAFCRVAAVKGALYVLRRPIDALLTDKESGRCRGVRAATGQPLFSDRVILGPSFARQVAPRGGVPSHGSPPHGSAGDAHVAARDASAAAAVGTTDDDDGQTAQTSDSGAGPDETPGVAAREGHSDADSGGGGRQVARCVCVVDRSLVAAEQQMLLLTFPPKSVGGDASNEYPIRALQIGWQAHVCPPGRFVVQLASLCPPGRSAEDVLRPAVDALFERAQVAAEEEPASASLSHASDKTSSAIEQVPAGGPASESRDIQPPAEQRAKINEQMGRGGEVSPGGDVGVQGTRGTDVSTAGEDHETVPAQHDTWQGDAAPGVATLREEEEPVPAAGLRGGEDLPTGEGPGVMGGVDSTEGLRGRDTGTGGAVSEPVAEGNEQAEGGGRPRLLWCVFYCQHAYGECHLSKDLPCGAWACDMPDARLDYTSVAESARQMFAEVFPEAPFFATAEAGGQDDDIDGVTADVSKAEEDEDDDSRLLAEALAPTARPLPPEEAEPSSSHAAEAEAEAEAEAMAAAEAVNAQAAE